MKPPLKLAALALLLGVNVVLAQEQTPSASTKTDIGAAYSELEMRAKLAVTPDARCEDDDCIAALAFRNRVIEIGQRVSDAAYSHAFEINQPVPSFLITVPGKDDIGTVSSGTGNIVVFDGLRTLRPQDPLLAFLIAREMGHIMAGHHEDNSYISLGFSVALTLLFPVANLMRGVEAAAAAATTTSLATTAVSMAGSRIVRGLYKADQRREADRLALSILSHAGWSAFDVVAALQASMPLVIGEGWMAELRESRALLDQVAVGPPLPPPVIPEPVIVNEPVEPVVLTPTEFAALLPPGVDAHEAYWGGLWRQGAWRSERACVPLTEPQSVAPQAIDAPAAPVRVATPCRPRGKGAKRCVDGAEAAAKKPGVKKPVVAKKAKPAVRAKPVKPQKRKTR